MGELADHAGILLHTVDAPQAPWPYEQYWGGSFTGPGAVGSEICGAGNAIPGPYQTSFHALESKDGWRQCRALRRFENQLALWIVPLLF